MIHRGKIRKLAVSVIASAVLILSANFITAAVQADSGFKVFGFVSTDVKSLKEGIKVELSSGLCAVTDKRGYFELSGVPKGTYTLKSAKKGILKRSIALNVTTANVMVSNADHPVRLWVGDLNQDNTVNMSDVLEVSKSFNSKAGDSLYVSDNDLNMDGAINLEEVILIAGRFNISSSNYPNYSIGMENDITPEGISEETGCRIYKSNNFESCVFYDDEFIPIGKGFGGFGVTDIMTCDFDGNGRKDLIYTYSFGSGLHRSHIGILSLDDKKETVLDYVYLDRDIALKKISDSCFEAYDSIDKDKLLARISLVNGKITVEKVV